ncbi:MATE family efflux transporter [Vibrio metschnikovii]|uniref:MATE family efflux transporter n=1 Tax=Vibrio metschnikovii TaxID=28172 RepID=UPI00193C009E|nr:MATE family efflux transporter [Vibrio metschnikovii]
MSAYYSPLYDDWHGAGAHTSLKMGAGETSSAINYLIHGLLLLVAVGLPLGIALHFLSPMFLHFQGATDGAYLQGADYLYWMMAGAPIVLGSIALPLLVRNAGAPRLATLAMGIGAISNIALDALFIGYFRLDCKGSDCYSTGGADLRRHLFKLFY